ncbi:CAP domain-containing protein [Pseudomonas sp. SA3-5]|uniref:CAP domain-containing protein n=1 Tax=Pseudomonas aestuarii TaxID=3018340 RepID=A0ABT4XJP9_9PSED|nr:CAP domain-containing protein [Pseudomonas aestuarii]MDA7088456.1 CAP domain-containing protein [Pseudomonas aestuarii]
MPPTAHSTGCRAQRNRLTALTLATVALLSGAAASASDSQQLIALINQYRESPQTCVGQLTEVAGPLVPDARLARVQLASSVQLQDALQRVGYQAATVKVITLSGPGSVDAAIEALKQRYCASLLDVQYAEVGVQRTANTWQVILARSLLPSGLPDWQAAGQELLQLVNAARAKPQRCNRQAMSPVGPLRWSEPLGHIALAHSRDMAVHNYFSHRAKDGSLAGTRAMLLGYDWQLIGENIGAGQGTAKHTVAGWLASPTYCFNLMNPDFTEMGGAYALNPQSDAAIYWTLLLGTPQ